MRAEQKRVVRRLVHPKRVLPKPVFRKPVGSTAAWPIAVARMPDQPIWGLLLAAAIIPTVAPAPIGTPVYVSTICKTRRVAPLVWYLRVHRIGPTGEPVL